MQVAGDGLKVAPGSDGLGTMPVRIWDVDSWRGALPGTDGLGFGPRRHPTFSCKTDSVVTEN
jgi:hypothetical protein